MENNVVNMEFETVEMADTVVVENDPKQKPKKQKKYRIKTQTPFTWIWWVFMMAFAGILLFRFYWILITASKSLIDFELGNRFGLPRSKSANHIFAKAFGFRLWENIKTSIDIFPVKILKNGRQEYVRLPELVYNSFAYTMISSVSTTMCHYVVAYSCAKYKKYRWTKWLHSMVIILMVIPLVGGMAGDLRLIRGLGLWDNLYAMAWLKWSFLGMNFLIFYAAVKGVPQDYWDAASLDGAGNCTQLFRIHMPMNMNLIIGLWVMSFMGFWNDWQICLYYIPSYPVIAYSLYNIMNSTETVSSGKIPLHFAASIIASIPSAIMFIIFRNRFLGNVSMGGLKA